MMNNADDELFAKKMIEEIMAQEHAQIEASNAHEYANVIDDFYDPFDVNEDTHLGQTFMYLKENMDSFDEHMFITYMKDTWAHPNTVDLDHPKKILICSSEHNVMPLTQIKHNYLHTFAQYYWEEEGVTPIPLGCFSKNETTIKPVKERMYNTTFIGCLNRNRTNLASILSGVPRLFMFLGFYLNDPRMMKFINHMVKWRHPRDFYSFNPDFNAGVKGDVFMNILNNSKICLVPRGWTNAETYRLYEAMNAGCVVICEKLPDRKYFKNIPVIQVDNWKDGLKKARDLLKDDALLQELSNKSKMFYDEFLSPIATAKIIMEKLENKKEDRSK
jgi:hypothetical protein